MTESSRVKPLRRVHDINKSLLQAAKSIYRLRRVGAWSAGKKSVYAYTVSLAKNPPQTLEEQVLCFYAACQSLLTDGESIQTGPKCFKIISDEFELIYCMEAWRKHADKRVYLENGQVKTEFLHRISTEQAAYIFRKYLVNPFDFLNSLESLAGIDDPADKYAALARFKLFLSAQKDLPK